MGVKELEQKDVLVVVEDGQVTLYYGGRPFTAAVYYVDEDKLVDVGQVPSFRSFKKIVKDAKG